MNQNDAIVSVDAQFKQFLDGVNAPKTRFRTGPEAMKEIHALERGRTPAAPARPTYKNPPNMRSNQTAFGNNYDANFEAFLDDASNTKR